MNNKYSYWIFLDAYTYASLKSDLLILYNSLTGKILEYKEPVIIKLAKELLSDENMNVAGLSNKDLENKTIAGFLDDLRANFMGDIISTSNTDKKPIQLKPLVKLDRDVKYLEKHAFRSLGDFIMDYLSELNIFITGSCKLDCGFCNTAYKQMNCCTKNFPGNLGLEKISNFLKECEACTILNYNILGGDIFLYPNLKNLIATLNNYEGNKTYFSHYKNIINQQKISLLENSKSFINILIDGTINPENYLQLSNYIKGFNIKFSYIFLIESDEQFNNIENLISSNPPSDYLIKPLFNGTNQKFFEENIYIMPEDISESKPALQEIYARQKLNTNWFGRLTILTNGEIYANINNKKLGDLNKTPLEEVLIKEMSDTSSWRKIRSEVTPCKDCGYDNLCPSLSNYEMVLNKNNLCHILY